MCGITGSIWIEPELGISPEVLQAMTSVLAHRGPDDSGFLTDRLIHQPPYGTVPGVALGFRRLSIIDLVGGAQPICNEDESVWVLFNGEIYNYPTLRKRLEGAGHRFRTRCDSETIVHLYEDAGERCFEKLNGMFAIAIWDRRLRRLVLGRDRLGQKPLVYHFQPGRLTFASELKSLLQVPGIPRELDYNAVDEYLTYQYVPHPNTIYRHIRKLPPGCLAIYRDGQLTTKRYWCPDFQVEQRIGRREAQEQLVELLESSVRMRMQADVPLGAFLSGGVDSSLIVALMQKHSNRPVKTFSIGFPIESYDETAYARQVAEHIGSEHHEFQVTPDAIDILPKLVEQFDEPFADSSAIPTWYVSQMTREHVTVALSGDGGDELFAGYPRYRAVRLAGWLDCIAPLRRVLGAKFWQWLPGSAKQKGLIRRFKRFSSGMSMSPLRRYLDWISIFNEQRRAELYSENTLSELADSDPFMFLESAAQGTNRRDRVTSTSLTDLVTYLPGDLMTKVDMASMAHSLEVRQPFLDYRLVEFAASLPLRMKMRGLQGKRLLRQSFEPSLPNAIWRRPKMGFGVPLDHWFRHELKEMTHDVLLGDQARRRGFFQTEAVEQLINQHESRTFDHSYRLWALLIFELWLRQWHDSPKQLIAVSQV